MDSVENQYTKWIYPAPIDDMVQAIKDKSYIEIGDPLNEWPRYWPHKRGIDKMDILIAGCGSIQAAYYACRLPNCNILGIDLSTESLKHQEKLKHKHQLDNLTLKKISLLDLDPDEKKFDFIVSSGVLHHLPNPDEGLLALAKVLKPEGVMSLMVYGTSLRLGVYMLQEVFKILGFRQTKDDVELVKATINTLNSKHVLRNYTSVVDDINYDAGVVDTFLHPQDTSYYARDIFSFTRGAGLEFVSWNDPLPYSLKANIPAMHPLWKKLNGISLEDEAQICDLLDQSRGTHRWIAAHPEYAKKIVIPTNSIKLLTCTVIMNPAVIVLEAADQNKKTTAKCKRINHFFEIHHFVTLVIERLNNNNSIKEVVDLLITDPKKRQEMYLLTIEEISTLHINGHLFILLPQRLC